MDMVILNLGVMIGGVQVDLFFYREPEESKDRDEEEAAAPEYAAAGYAAPAIGLGGEQWGLEAAEAGQWEPSEGAAVASGVPAGAEWAAPAAAPVAGGWDVGAAAVAPPGWDTAAAAAPAAPAGWEPAAL